MRSKNLFFNVLLNSRNKPSNNIKPRIKEQTQIEYQRHQTKNQRANPATTLNPELKSKPRLNIRDIKPSNNIKPRIKEQTQQRHFPYSLIGHFLFKLNEALSHQTQQRHQRI